MHTEGISSCKYVDEIDCTYVSMFMCTGAHVCGYIIMLCLGLPRTFQAVVCAFQRTL